jgi:hypothetical protein
MAAPPSGFVNRPKVRSVAEAVSLDSHDRIVSVAKNALQAYIASFLDTTGFNRNYTKAISTAALQYVTDKSLQDNPDPNKKPTQLARMFNEIRQRLPAIMIIDAGLIWEEPGLGGGLERVSAINGNWQGWYRIAARINVVVACVTQDPESCSMLQNLISIFCKQLRVEAGGSRMTSGKPHEYWEVRVPLNFNSTINQPSNVADDPKDQIWASTIEMELQAEDMFVIERPIPRTILDGAVVNDPDLSLTYRPTLDAPSTVKLSDGPFMIVPARMGDQHRLALSDGRIASLDPDSLMVTPHRTGSFDIFILDTTQRQETAPVPWARKVVLTHPVVVTF